MSIVDFNFHMSLRHFLRFLLLTEGLLRGHNKKKNWAQTQNNVVIILRLRLQIFLYYCNLTATTSFQQWWFILFCCTSEQWTREFFHGLEYYVLWTRQSKRRRGNISKKYLYIYLCRYFLWAYCYYSELSIIILLVHCILFALCPDK